MTGQDRAVTAFQSWKAEGLVPTEAAAAGRELGLDTIDCIRGLRAAYGLTILEAKDAMARASGWAGLAEQQETLLPALKAALETEDD